MCSNPEETVAASTYRLTGDSLAAANAPESLPVTLPHRPKAGPATEDKEVAALVEPDPDDLDDEEINKREKPDEPGEPGDEAKPKPKKKKKRSKGSKGKVCAVSNDIARWGSLDTETPF
jgi:hypothetical protein